MILSTATERSKNVSGPPSRMLWIELCQNAGVDPHKLISRCVEQAMSSILTASTIDSKVFIFPYFLNAPILMISGF
jgi:hypothetical protein